MTTAQPMDGHKHCSQPVWPRVTEKAASSDGTRPDLGPQLVLKVQGPAAHAGAGTSGVVSAGLIETVSTVCLLDLPSCHQPFYLLPTEPSTADQDPIMLYPRHFITIGGQLRF